MLLAAGPWTLARAQAFQDPVAAATREIARTNAWWTPLGYGVKKAQFTVGWITSAPAGYVLLSGPTLGHAAVVGGVPGLAAELSSDIVVALIEQALATPAVIASHIANEHKRLAWNQYETAYAVATGYLDTGRLTEAGARAFLENRWGILELEAAGVLKASTNSRKGVVATEADYITRQAVEAVLRRYQLDGLGMTRSLPIADAAFLIREIRDLLIARKSGIGAYQPYLDFLATLERIDRLRREELARVGGNEIVALDSTDAPTAPSTPGDRVVLILDASSSMAGKKLADAKSAAREVLGGLVGTGTAVALVRFSGPCHVDVIPFTTSHDEVTRAVDQTVANGSTALAAALRAAADLVRTGGGAAPAVVLLTDGMETCEPPAQAVAEAEALGRLLR